MRGKSLCRSHFFRCLQPFQRVKEQHELASQYKKKEEKKKRKKENRIANIRLLHTDNSQGDYAGVIVTWQIFNKITRYTRIKRRAYHTPNSYSLNTKWNKMLLIIRKRREIRKMKKKERNSRFYCDHTRIMFDTRIGVRLKKNAAVKYSTLNSQPMVSGL